MWDRRTLREDHPKPVGNLAGHHDGITFIDSKVRAYIYVVYSINHQVVILHQTVWYKLKLSNDSLKLYHTV